MNLSAPAVPPRPYSSQSHRGPGGAPLVSPRPQRVDPELPANLQRLSGASYSSSPPPINNIYNMPTPPFAGGFAVGPPPPSYEYDSYPGPGPNGGAHNPHHAPSLPMPMAGPPGGGADGFNASFNRLSLGVPDNYARQRRISAGPGVVHSNGANTNTPFMPAPAPILPFNQPQQAGKPELTAPLPTVATLKAALPAIESPSADLASKVSWIRDVLLLVTRTSLPPPSSTDTATFGDTPAGALKIVDPALEQLTVQHALPLLLSLPHIPNAASGAQPQLPAPSTITPANAEALFIHASLLTSGGFPTILPQNQRIAFREFECAARAGWGAAWYRIGRDYERFGDVARSKDSYEKGAGIGVGGGSGQSQQEDPSCAYRLAIAHLLGQLSLPRNTATGLRLLARAAALSSVPAPHPAYVFGLVLLGEGPRLGFWRENEDGEVDRSGIVAVGKNKATEGKRWLERSAYLGFVPAQYKLGHCYEFAEPHPPFGFDPLMSVQYYSLASQAGEAEADMALSKWFLCGSDPDAEAGQASRDGGFAKDESLAYVFAEKAANKGLVSAEFALGYYSEVGIGTSKDVRKAVRWYEIAASHGSADARQRLEAIGPLPPAGPSGPIDQSAGLSRTEHDALTQNRLVRKRTQAKQRSGTVDRMQPQMGGQAVLENVRQEAARPMGLPSNPRPPAHQQYHSQPQPTAMPPPRQTSLVPNAMGAPAGPMPGVPGADGLTPAQQIAVANRPRYSLADPGFTPPGGSPHTTSPRMRPAGANSSPMGSPRMRPSAGGHVPGQAQAGFGAGRGGGGRVPSGPSDGFRLNGGGPGEKTAQSPPPTKYNTFADMGIQGKSADDKDCVIM